jgi:hypothetical protein
VGGALTWVAKVLAKKRGMEIGLSEKRVMKIWLAHKRGKEIWFPFSIW